MRMPFRLALFGGTTMSNWEPEEFHHDPMVNAILNIAAELNFCGRGISSLLYGLKYGKEDGMSVAEAIEVAAGKIEIDTGSIQDGLESVAAGLGDVAKAIKASR
jgi:hypothetical protein